MEAFIARLRHRNKASPSVESLPQETTTETPIQEIPHAPTIPHAPSSISSIARKIHPDLDALVAQLDQSSHAGTSVDALTPRRRSVQRRSLGRRAGRARSRSNTSPGSPTTTSPHASIGLAPRRTHRLEQLAHASPPSSVRSSPDPGYYAAALRRGLGLSEFGVTEAPDSRSGSDWEQEEALSSPTTSTSNSNTQHQGRQRDSRSTGASTQTHSRHGSRSTPPARPQSAFMTRFSGDNTTTLTDIVPTQPPSPSEVTHPINTNSGSETTSNAHYESAVTSIRSSSRNSESPAGSQSRHSTLTMSRLSDARTPNTFGFATPSTSNPASLSYGQGNRPPLPPVEEFEARIQNADRITRRRSESVDTSTESNSRSRVWPLRRNTMSSSVNVPASQTSTSSEALGNSSTLYESAVTSLRSSLGHSESPDESPSEARASVRDMPGPSSLQNVATPNTFGFSTPMITNPEIRPPVPPIWDIESRMRSEDWDVRKRSKSMGSSSRSQSRPRAWAIRKKRSKSSNRGDEPAQRGLHISESSQSTAKPDASSRSRTQSTHSAKPFKMRGSRSKSQTSLSSRRASADWSAQQATAGVSWEADVAREMLKYLGMGTNPDSQLQPSHLAQGPGSHDNLYRPGEASSSSLASQDKLSYTHSGEVIYLESRIDNSRTSATTSPSHRRRDDKGKSKEDMHSGSPSQNTVTFTDHDREGNAAAASGGGSSRVGQGSSSRNTGSFGRKSSPPKSALRPQVTTSASLLQPPQLELTLPTPDGSPGRRSASEPAAPLLQSSLKVPGQISRSTTSGSSKGKRKADDVDGSPPKAEKETHRATFAAEPRSHRASANSGSSHAPSSYHRKRARLSLSESLSPTASRERENLTGTISSRSSSAQPYQTPQRTPSRAPSRTSARAMSSRSQSNTHSPRQPRRSMSEMSQTSIPISALISPHAPSISQYSTTYHMRDPRRPPKPFETPWSLRLPSPNEPGSGSPIHAWMFFIGFVIFPLWWIASFWRIPRTRKMGGTDVEKAVVLDDPQVEFDAKSWRFRCRIMSAISFLTYIPFIVLVAIFAR